MKFNFNRLKTQTFYSDKKKEKGEALISAVIGAFLIIAVVGIALSSTHQMLSGEVLPSKSPALCREVASEVVNLIRSNGTQARAFKTPINGDTLLLRNESWHSGEENYNADGVSTEYGIGGGYFDRRWPNTPVINWSGSSNYRSHSPRLIQSSLNALLSIYNGSPASCNNELGINLTNHPVLSALAPRDDIDNHTVDVSMRIRPYNVRTGQLTPNCENNLWIRPYALSEPPRAEQDQILDLSAYTPNRGLEAEIFVEVTPTNQTGNNGNRDGGEQEENTDTFRCSLKNRFQYDMSYTRPLPPVAEMNGSGRLVIDLNEDNRSAPGTHMVCRDNYIRYNFGGPGAWNVPPAIVAQKNFPGPSGGWGPCDELTVCERSPNDVNTNNAQTRMSLEYNIPNDCMVNVEVRNIDTVGNVSSVSSVGYYNSVPGTGTYDDGGGGGGSPGGYEVNGTEYSSLSSAQTAADAAGLTNADINPVENIGPEAVANTAAMNSVHNSTGQAVGSMTDAANAAASAQSAAGTAAAAAGSATSSSTGASSARSSATAARSAATSARSSATAARSSATAAANAAASAAATAAANPTPANQNTAQQAQTAANMAEESATAAEQAAAEAEAAALAAEQAAAEKEAEESDNDDDDGP